MSRARASEPSTARPSSLGAVPAGSWWVRSVAVVLSFVVDAALGGASPWCGAIMLGALRSAVAGGGRLAVRRKTTDVVTLGLLGFACWWPDPR